MFRTLAPRRRRGGGGVGDSRAPRPEFLNTRLGDLLCVGPHATYALQEALGASFSRDVLLELESAIRLQKCEVFVVRVYEHDERWCRAANHNALNVSTS
jgi:hypothetical protein